MKRVLHRLKIIETIVNLVTVDIIAWMIFAMMMLVMVEVVARYIFNSPFGIADEISAFMLIAIIFVGTAYTWKEKGHIRIDVLVSRLPSRVRVWLRLATLILATAFVPVLIKAYYDLVLRSRRFDWRSEHWLRLQLEWPQLIMFIGAILLFIVMLIELIKSIREITASRSGEQK